ncbi:MULTISPECIES: hypothetical protein [Nitrincola]|uniref:Uncharacterized protein n=1 Tax=Nitrincola nitratireducens TaxID=1229521 RepID=W9UY95_9GAMM|nr:MULTISPECIES: hypothetical protein [Nitrincola]EXJ12213.1 hypothetical protein D791_01102 [Nitrincola nitratireducens]
MDFKRTEAKITIAKLIELAYSKNKGMTAKIMAEKGNAQLTVDHNGNATLSGSAGMLTFSGTPVLENVGAKIKRININFRNEEGMKVDYTATFDLEYIKLSVMGDFDLEELMTSCSGLLCQAARAFKGRDRAYNMELQRIMGH